MKYTLLLMCLLFSILSFSQEEKKTIEKDTYKSSLAIGAGYGLNYGVFGGQLAVRFAERIDLFVGLGYNSIEPSANVGLSVLLSRTGQLRPKASLMFGNNAILVREKRSGRSYLGFSIGGGFDFYINKTTRNYFSVGAYYLKLSSEFEDDIDRLKRKSQLNTTYSTSHLVVSIGYHYRLASF